MTDRKVLSSDFVARREALIASISTAAGGDPPETHDDWNNFPNYFQFSNFSNAYAPQYIAEEEKAKT